MRGTRVTAVTALLSTVAILNGCKTLQETARNAPAAVTPILVRVSRSGPTEIQPVLGSFPVLPSRAVIVDVRMPWPANVEVRLDGQVLERVKHPSERARELEGSDVGYFDFEVDARTTPPEWRLTVSPPPSKRRAGAFRIEIVMLSINPAYSGSQQRSEPLTVRVRDDSGVVKFHGRAFLYIDHEIESIRLPKTQDVAFDVRITTEDSKLEIVSFPDIVVGPYDVGLGQNTTTIKRVGGGAGTFDGSTGAVSLSIRLRFEHSHPLALASEVPFNLTTGEVGRYPQWGLVAGSPLDLQTGELQLAGVSTFEGGLLGGHLVQLSIRGILGP